MPLPGMYRQSAPPLGLTLVALVGALGVLVALRAVSARQRSEQQLWYEALDALSTYQGT